MKNPNRGSGNHPDFTSTVLGTQIATPTKQDTTSNYNYKQLPQFDTFLMFISSLPLLYRSHRMKSHGQWDDAV
jgi:hypothetical protein